MQRTPGAIGYVELVYALDNHIPYADVQNHDGKWVTASLDGITAAAAASDSNMPADFRVSITDAPGPDSYPISSFTWLLVYQQQTDRAKGEQIVKFLRWALARWPGVSGGARVCTYSFCGRCARGQAGRGDSASEIAIQETLTATSYGPDGNVHDPGSSSFWIPFGTRARDP